MQGDIDATKKFKKKNRKKNSVSLALKISGNSNFSQIGSAHKKWKRSRNTRFASKNVSSNNIEVN